VLRIAGLSGAEGKAANLRLMSFQILSFVAPLLWCVFACCHFFPIGLSVTSRDSSFRYIRDGDISFRYLRRGFVKENAANTLEQDDPPDGLWRVQVCRANANLRGAHVAGARYFLWCVCVCVQMNVCRQQFFFRI
jgi:hypothetical protein